jgi:pantoate--beta-alanine ligase
MLLLKNSADFRLYLDRNKKQGQRVGFVPTMGALHEGHISLIESSVRENSITTCSIFVNPRQFNDPKDYEKYPITIEKDIQMLESAGCTVLLLPSVDEVYLKNENLPSHYDLGYLETVLEGQFRPGHFQGVCMVVHRLLRIAQPDRLYLGQKDYQQCMVIKRLIQLVDDTGIQVQVCPTLREPDGLAMSSRNLRLTKDEREKAPAIFHTLQWIKENLKKGNLKDLKAIARTKLAEQDFKVDYVEIADAVTLELADEWNGEQKLVALAAAFLNEVRLIDNFVM